MFYRSVEGRHLCCVMNAVQRRLNVDPGREARTAKLAIKAKLRGRTEVENHGVPNGSRS